MSENPQAKPLVYESGFLQHYEKRCAASSTLLKLTGNDCSQRMREENSHCRTLKANNKHVL